MLIIKSEKSKKISEANTVTFTCSDYALETMAKVLTVCRSLGSVGASREVKFGFDGDGSAKMDNIEINGKPIKEWMEENIPDFEFDSNKSEIRC